MKKSNTYILLIIFFSLIYYSCNNNEQKIDGNTVVSVKGKILSKTELKDAIPLGSSKEDSTAIAEAYINMWVNDELIYDKAKQNITNEKTIDDLVEQYRKSLIINTYQEQLLKEYFANTIAKSDLKSYYEENKDKFILDENIIRGLYLKIPIESKELSNFQKWYKQETDEAIENIEKNTLQNVVGYEYFYDKWLSFENVMENIPELIKEEQQFLKQNKNLEVRDSSFVYLLNIKEYKLAGSEAPYEYIKGQIAEVYMEQRKASYLKQVREDLYNKAISNGEIKFYNE